jgi:hypothetical protein
LNGDAVADFDFAAPDRESQRRVWPMQDLKIARDANSKRDQMFLKSLHVLQSADPKNGISKVADVRRGKTLGAT